MPRSAEVASPKARYRSWVEKNLGALNDVQDKGTILEQAQRGIASFKPKEIVDTAHLILVVLAGHEDSTVRTNALALLTESVRLDRGNPSELIDRYNYVLNSLPPEPNLENVSMLLTAGKTMGTYFPATERSHRKLASTLETIKTKIPDMTITTQIDDLLAYNIDRIVKDFRRNDQTTETAIAAHILQLRLQDINITSKHIEDSYGYPTKKINKVISALINLEYLESRRGKRKSETNTRNQQLIIKDLQAGVTATIIAERYGLTLYQVTYISSQLQDKGELTDRRKLVKRSKPKEFSEDELPLVHKIRALRTADPSLSTYAIGKQLGVYRSFVERAIKFISPET